MVFDAPGRDGEFEARLAFLHDFVKRRGPAFAVAHAHQACQDLDALRAELDRVEALGGEGLMLRRPGSRYEVGRSSTLLKVKRFHDAEARVVGHQPGKGRHKGRLGALEVEIADGTRFAVGTGFSDAERSAPPPVGSVVTFRYQELSDGGVPATSRAMPACGRADRADPPGWPRGRRPSKMEGSGRVSWSLLGVCRPASCRIGVHFGSRPAGGPPWQAHGAFPAFDPSGGSLGR